jgi:hypothetical protein
VAGAAGTAAWTAAAAGLIAAPGARCRFGTLSAVTAGDDAERSDEEERRKVTAGDDAERSDEEERRR